MIDAKLKAQELVWQFGTLVEIHHWDGTNQDRQDVYSYDPRLSSANSKACALIVVDEIIDAINDMEDPTVFINGEWNNAITYWASVKEYINTL